VSDFLDPNVFWPGVIAACILAGLCVLIVSLAVLIDYLWKAHRDMMEFIIAAITVITIVAAVIVLVGAMQP
jgi:hypothetical protein